MLATLYQILEDILLCAALSREAPSQLFPSRLPGGRLTGGAGEGRASALQKQRS